MSRASFCPREVANAMAWCIDNRLADALVAKRGPHSRFEQLMRLVNTGLVSSISHDLGTEVVRLNLTRYGSTTRAALITAGWPKT